MITTLKRSAKLGIQNFWRNGSLSIATILVMILTLFTIISLMLVSVTANSLVEKLKNKIDISVYFKENTKEEEIQSVIKQVSLLNQTKTVEYISKDGALIKFKEEFKDDPLIMQSLAELEINPLRAHINIKAKDPSQFAEIASFIEQGKFKEIIEKNNYYKNQNAIQKFNSMINTVQKVGLIIGLILSIISLLISFNTIRIAIYTSKEEIAVMKLVGATNLFVRGSFIIEGFLYGLFGSVITMALYYLTLLKLSPSLINVIEFDIFTYFKENLWQISLIIFGLGSLVSISSSFIAVRKYLKI